MYRYQCAAATMNSQAHSEFTRALAEFSQRYAQDGFSRSEAQDLVEFIDGWLATHIVRVDVQLKPCVENERLG
jgi:hemerythrin